MKNPYKVIEGTGIIPEGTEKIIPEAFEHCEEMTELVIPDSVTEIGEKAFMHCGELTHLVIPDSVKTIGSFAFSFCWKLKSIVLPNSIKELEKGAFFGTGISEIIIPDSVEKIGTHCFTRCPDLASISVSKGNAYFDSRDNCNAIIETATNTLIQGCHTTTIPNSVTKIGEKACSECRHLKQIIIPDSVTEIGSEAFSSCDGLNHIHISASVTKIGSRAFDYCGDNLTSITIDEGNKYYDSRENCNALIETATNTLVQGCNSTVIPNSVVKIGNDAFWDCKCLEHIIIPDSVTTIGCFAFLGCRNLKSIVFSNSLVKIGNRAFERCEKLENIVIPSSLREIGQEVFSGCDSLCSLAVAEGNQIYDSREGCNAIIETASNKLVQGCNTTVIPDSIVIIGNDAFCGMKGLKNILIPNSVRVIEQGAFSSCYNLGTVQLPSSVRVIEQDAFRGCYRLKIFVNDDSLIDFSNFPPEVTIVRTGQTKTENLWRLATDCFETTSAGRRPWGIKDEITFHKKMVEGYELATKYISLSGDFSHFPDWFSILNPCRTDSLIEEVSNWIDRNEDVQNLRWEHYSYEDVVAYLEDTLDKQMFLLWKWLDGDAEGFVNYWGAERIENLLELVEDDVFYDVLRKLASLKHNQTATDILAFYAEDDEPQIKSYALKLLEEYRL